MKLFLEFTFVNSINWRHDNLNYKLSVQFIRGQIKLIPVF